MLQASGAACRAGPLTEGGVPARAQVVLDVKMDAWHACIEAVEAHVGMTGGSGASAGSSARAVA